MIEKYDVRIGNTIKYTAHKDLSRTYHNKTIQVTTSIIDDLGHSIKQNWFEGIVLSPEILEKCGFVLNRNNELSIEINDIASHLELMRGVDGFYYPSFTQTPQGDEERTVYFNRINSLHQLQNLYFSLCGEELNYTP